MCEVGLPPISGQNNYKDSLFKHLGKTFMDYWMRFYKYSTGTSSLPLITFEVSFCITKFDTFDSVGQNTSIRGYTGM